MMNGFKNFHLSVSRLRRYDQCPQSFKLHYVEEKPSEPGEAGEFGKLLHDTLERLFVWVVDEEFTGFLPENKLVEFYRLAWQVSGLSGFELFQQGLSILRSYLRKHPKIDHFNVLAVELEFNIQIEEFVLNGRIDRVDRVNDDTVRICDYKSNRMLYTRDELDTDLQMSVYAIAARHLWPWAKNFEFAFHMLRHDTILSTLRTEEQIEDAAVYVTTVGRQTESDLEFKARINPYCGYCDHRSQCASYEKALAEKVERVAFHEDELEKIAEMRERVATLAKIAYRRKDELDMILRTHLERTESKELEVGEMRYRLVSASTTEYPSTPTVEKIARVAGMDRNDVGREILVVNNKLLDALVERVQKNSTSRGLLLKAELETLVERVPMKPRLYVTKITKRLPRLSSKKILDRVQLLPGGDSEESGS